MNFKLTEEQDLIRKNIREFCVKNVEPIAAEIDEKEAHPADLFKKLGEGGWMGIPIPAQYGGSGSDYLTHAICCGELMRALGHALQIEVADSGITLQLQLGLSLGDNLSGLSHGELLLSDTVQRALALSQHSRNLLLIERQIGDDSLLRQRSRIRPIASPEGACCVERLLDPYPALLERQLTRMHDARGR